MALPPSGHSIDAWLMGPRRGEIGNPAGGQRRVPSKAIRLSGEGCSAPSNGAPSRCSVSLLWWWRWRCRVETLVSQVKWSGVRVVCADFNSCSHPSPLSSWSKSDRVESMKSREQREDELVALREELHTLRVAYLELYAQE